MSREGPPWILPAVMRAIHARQIAEHGGEPGLRDEGLLGSALARPRNRFSCESGSVDTCDLAALQIQQQISDLHRMRAGAVVPPHRLAGIRNTQSVGPAPGG